MFSKRKLDAATLDAMSDALIAADIAPEIAADITAKLRAKFRPDADTTETEIKRALADILRPYAEKLTNHKPQITGHAQEKPQVFLVIGVNGAGKTTTIGKLAKQWTDAGKRIVIGACDTFRAAANEQLAEWAARAGAKLICGGKDPAAAAYKTIELAGQENADIVILDTAGRLHNRTDLMDELSKIIRVIKKLDESAPHEILLTLDGTAGQNALNQIEYFNKTAPLTGLIITKMDSTSKGGFLITYAARIPNPESRIPIYAVGMGEKITDLRAFDANEYIEKLLDL
ncbi:MAG: signal recognition particle-docking protein FtsY [Alphaproteobacteria bacterium]|nr:signal recognition particle-docking protein FtsY [Alphaproteobacteria bacterium]